MIPSAVVQDSLVGSFPLSCFLASSSQAESCEVEEEEGLEDRTDQPAICRDSLCWLALSVHFQLFSDDLEKNMVKK